MLIHVAQRGETLWQAANQYRVNINEIVRLNELPNPNQLHVGLALLIPVQRQRSHLVRTGETLWSISIIPSLKPKKGLDDNVISSSFSPVFLCGT